MSKKIDWDGYFVVDDSFINAVISNYHKWMIKDDHCGVPWEEREDFIKNEFRKGLKRVYHPCYTIEEGLHKHKQMKDRQEKRKEFLKSIKKNKKREES